MDLIFFYTSLWLLTPCLFVKKIVNLNTFPAAPGQPLPSKIVHKEAFARKHTPIYADSLTRLYTVALSC